MSWLTDDLGPPEMTMGFSGRRNAPGFLLHGRAERFP